MDAEQLIEVAESLGHRTCLGQGGQGRFRVGPPAERHAERGRRVQLPAPGGWIAGAGDADRLASQLLRLRERPLEHQELRQARHDGRAGDRRRRRDEIDGAASCRERALGIAGRSPELGQTVVQQPEPDAVAAAVRRADGRVEIGSRSDRAPGCECRLGRPGIELGRREDGRIAPAATALP